jgi:hypothetical protein
MVEQHEDGSNNKYYLRILGSNNKNYLRISRINNKYYSGLSGSNGKCYPIVVVSTVYQNNNSTHQTMFSWEKQWKLFFQIKIYEEEMASQKWKVVLENAQNKIKN